MPNIKSAAKRMRSDAKKAANNKVVLSELKTLDAKLHKSGVDAGKAKEIAAKLIMKLDKAVSRGIIPRGRADRKKSRIAAFVKKLK